MWFLVRLAFWLSLVIVLLPGAQSQQNTCASQIGATDAISAASAAVSDIRQFCERQPDACATGTEAIEKFGQKAQTGAKLLYQFLGARVGESQSGAGKGSNNSMERLSRGTLTPSDLATPWHGPLPRKEAEARRSS